MPRRDGRPPDALRPIRLQRGYTKNPAGSVLVEWGRTMVLCTASVTEGVPEWLEGKGKGWLTSEYGMLPAATHDRKTRDITRGRPDGRSIEIQRLIGRSLRAVVDLAAIGERTLWLDCDVLQADGGTRTASVTGAYVALHDALTSLKSKAAFARWPLLAAVAGVSVGIVGGVPVLDLDYPEDSSAEVDMNVVMTSRQRFVEVQGTGEKSTFDEPALQSLLALAKKGIGELFAIQQSALTAG